MRKIVTLITSALFICVFALASAHPALAQVALPEIDLRAPLPVTEEAIAGEDSNAQANVNLAAPAPPTKLLTPSAARDSLNCCSGGSRYLIEGRGNYVLITDQAVKDVLDQNSYGNRLSPNAKARMYAAAIAVSVQFGGGDFRVTQASAGVRVDGEFITTALQLEDLMKRKSSALRADPFSIPAMDDLLAVLAFYEKQVGIGERTQATRQVSTGQ